jgi:hypothetical protein
LYGPDRTIRSRPVRRRAGGGAGGYFVGDYQGLDTIGQDFGAFFGQAIDQAADPSDVYFTRLTPAP